MPRGKKKANLRASEEREEAIQAATMQSRYEGQSIRNAANAFGVPYSTLRDHRSGM